MNFPMKWQKYLSVMNSIDKIEMKLLLTRIVCYYVYFFGAHFGNLQKLDWLGLEFKYTLDIVAPASFD